MEYGKWRFSNSLYYFWGRRESLQVLMHTADAGKELLQGSHSLFAGPFCRISIHLDVEKLELLPHHWETYDTWQWLLNSKGFICLSLTVTEPHTAQDRWGWKAPLEMAESNPTARSRVTYSRLLRAVSSQVLDISKDGHCTALFQCLTIITVRNFNI